MTALITAYSLVACAIAAYMLRIRLIDRQLRIAAARSPGNDAQTHHTPHRRRSAA